VVSFHFGLPGQALLKRVKAAGAKVISSATTVAEAVWLEKGGVDAVIATGFEAGGHRGSFLTLDMSSQPGTFALVPQVVDAVKVPVIAAGGIADGRGIAAAFALGSLMTFDTPGYQLAWPVVAGATAVSLGLFVLVLAMLVRSRRRPPAPPRPRGASRPPKVKNPYCVPSPRVTA